VDLAEVLGSWELHLRAERKSPQTVKAYGDGVRTYLAWCERAGRPTVLDRRQLREFVDALPHRGSEARDRGVAAPRRPPLLGVADRGGGTRQRPPAGGLLAAHHQLGK